MTFFFLRPVSMQTLPPTPRRLRRPPAVCMTTVGSSAIGPDRVTPMLGTGAADFGLPPRVRQTAASAPTPPASAQAGGHDGAAAAAAPPPSKCATAAGEFALFPAPTGRLGEAVGGVGAAKVRPRGKAARAAANTAPLRNSAARGLRGCRLRWQGACAAGLPAEAAAMAGEAQNARGGQGAKN
mmetsp:Transcript_91698/g.255391  ORF Transcript_91698/g.255391 Transcript_91698/m.255391 type:complete len:183 (+) Transcript_91698:76-624(+)